jgi:hypothetical protein
MQFGKPGFEESQVFLIAFRISQDQYRSLNWHRLFWAELDWCSLEARLAEGVGLFFLLSFLFNRSTIAQLSVIG